MVQLEQYIGKYPSWYPSIQILAYRQEDHEKLDLKETPLMHSTARPYHRILNQFSRNEWKLAQNNKKYCWFGWIPYQMRETHWKKIEFDGPQQILFKRPCIAILNGEIHKRVDDTVLVTFN
ncbi:hypothetical protein Tcan_03976 [Toxocara canis]|uniref:Uncharacterized protein n=1 Tax=Toxocara canis TaxID=6265 RepID=A0A0B2VLW9_TOXCA|nr:hypothetical protein Tcan_03976 [Toxocara canis]